MQCSLGSWDGLSGGVAPPSISHRSHPCSQDPNRFDRDRLFSAVARGNPQDLAGLPEYLRATSKYLTDSEYTGRPRPPSAEPGSGCAGCAGLSLLCGACWLWVLTMVRRRQGWGFSFFFSFLYFF